MTDSRSIFGLFIIVTSTILAVVVGAYVVTNPSGGIVGLVPLITVILSLVAIKNPRAGLFCLAALVIWVDEFKRLAVYYGGVNFMTVIQTLTMPFVVILAINFGFLLGIMFGKVKLDRIGILIYISATLVGAAIFWTTWDAGFAASAQRAANIAGYLTIIPICYTYLKNFDDWRKFFSFQMIMALPAAAWAIKQYYFGFNEIEWEYAKTGLSPTHYEQMFNFEKPRVFGFFSSASALGCAAIYCAYSWWHTLRYNKKRIYWLIAAAILTWVLIISTQRTALIYPLIVLVCAYGFRTRLRTLAMYSAGILVFVTSVTFSDYLLEDGLEEINETIASEGEWKSQVLRVSTFSDRLRGWQRLKRADSWSLFGTGKEDVSEVMSGTDYASASYNHDIINRILINFGIVGLIAVIIPSFIILKRLHDIVFKARQNQDRNDTAFALSLSLPMVFLSFVGGDNFNANPINIQIWTAFAGVFVCRVANQKNRSLADTLQKTTQEK